MVFKSELRIILCEGSSFLDPRILLVSSEEDLRKRNGTSLGPVAADLRAVISEYYSLTLILFLVV